MIDICWGSLVKETLEILFNFHHGLSMIHFTKDSELKGRNLRVLLKQDSLWLGYPCFS